MRKLVLLSIVLLIGLVTGCGGGVTPPPSSPSPTPPPSPTSPPPPTAVPETDTAEPTVAPEPSGPATCELFTLPVSDIPPVTEEDHVHGPDDAAITFIEYADFQ